MRMFSVIFNGINTENRDHKFFTNKQKTESLENQKMATIFQ